LPWDRLNKPKFIIEASLVRVNQTKIVEYQNTALMTCLNADNSFTLFDFNKRESGVPKFIQKYGVPFEPTSIEMIPDSGTILVAGYDPSLGIYKIKG
jgi:hypothetical protein